MLVSYASITEEKTNPTLGSRVRESYEKPFLRNHFFL